MVVTKSPEKESTSECLQSWYCTVLAAGFKLTVLLDGHRFLVFGVGIGGGQNDGKVAVLGENAVFGDVLSKMCIVLVVE